MDRVFWIYFIITLFFVIIGISSILSSANAYLVFISLVWLITNVCLMVLVYITSINWWKNENSQVCPPVTSITDPSSGCFKENNRIWLYINILFFLLLLASTIWASEINNTSDSLVKPICGILILLGGLLLANLTNFYVDTIIQPFWLAVTYLLLWTGLNIFIALTN